MCFWTFHCLFILFIQIIMAEVSQVSYDLSLNKMWIQHLPSSLSLIHVHLLQFSYFYLFVSLHVMIFIVNSFC